MLAEYSVVVIKLLRGAAQQAAVADAAARPQDRAHFES